ncbi:type II secretion system protein GspM [Acidocella aromatica]|uniref:General secretion pathway protein M n=1 Tax=Acidocella aromatica TaxID=1303579 RepID=A0A840V9N0_9PROT|nr:type II secretion system protein GspM [Acidocella aromatica]MBB5372214.1 general secretion pathway protein M [Acidocella aromatica]
MTDTLLNLPEGRRGQALALGMLAAALLLLWLAVIAPLLGWYQDRAAELAQQREEAAHMQALGREIPALRAELAAAGGEAAGHEVLLAGGTDAIAGANLQSALQTLAGQAGTSLDSAALLPAQPAGALRRISMQVSVTAPWPVLVALLQAIDTAQPSMVAGDIGITMGNQTDPSQPVPMQANFTVSGFRAGSGS